MEEGMEGIRILGRCVICGKHILETEQPSVFSIKFKEICDKCLELIRR